MSISDISSNPVTNPITINLTPETLALLNPNNLGYIPKSESEIELQINGVSYIVNLQNYVQFYIDLNANNINTLAKYLNKISNLSSEISYTKYYSSSMYEYDSRGYITINVPFNGKMVATIKYCENTCNSVANANGLQETSYVHNNYLATPVLITTSDGTVTEVIKRDAWGSINSNSYESNEVIPTSIGYTGHRQDYESNLTYAHSRYLSNTNRVWLSEDPMALTGFNTDYFIMNPQFHNSYSYVSNDPVNNIDPDGKKVEIISRQLNVDYPVIGRAFKLATHSFLKITPDNPDAFKGTMYMGNDGKPFFTISVDTDGYPYGNMTLVRNLPNDVSTAKNGYVKENGKVVLKQKDKLTVYPGNQTPDELAKRILKEVDAYGQDGLYSIYSTDGMNCNKMSYTLAVTAGGTPQWNKLSGVDWGFGNVQNMSNYPKSSSAKQKEQMYMMGIINVSGSPNSLILSKPTK